MKYKDIGCAEEWKEKINKKIKSCKLCKKEKKGVYLLCYVHQRLIDKIDKLLEV